MRRRQFISLLGLGTVGACTVAPKSKQNENEGAAMKSSPVTGHFFPALPYKYDALEPYIDAETMELHYDKHHRGYFNKFTAAIEDTPLETMPMRDIFAEVSKYGNSIRNNGGGYYNHTLFWQNMSPEKTEASEKLMNQIEEDFNSFDNFKDAFSDAAKTRFGSGWAWLILTDDKKLKVVSTPNQDNPLMDIAETKGIPLLALDVWEHAYYLNYQNRRNEYIQNFWNIVDWKTVNKRFEKALKGEWLG